MAWIEPLALETWVINVFAGSHIIFSAIALLIIAGLAGYFKMTGFVLGFLIVLFLAMFKAYTGIAMLFIALVIGGFLLGNIIKRIVIR